MNEEQMLDALRELLRDRIGEHRAITIAQIGEFLGHTSRRQTEVFLELHIADLGYCVVSSSSGYYRPARADDINHYRKTLKSRIRCMALRIKSVTRAARNEGWPRPGAEFTDHPQPQLL